MTIRIAFLAAIVTILNNVAVARGQSCVLGEAPADFCTQARTVSGDVGQHVVYVDATRATSVGESFCGVPVGHSSWFQFTPTVSTPVTISTCHPNTAFDTVLSVWSGGDSGCEFMSPVACVDDTPEDECVNGCSSFGSTIQFFATAGTRYRFAVGSYNNNAANCPLCLGVIVTIGQPCGDAPTNLACQLARELPGSAGTHSVAIDATDAVVLPMQSLPTCGTNVGHTVWFKVTPEVTGPVTFSTCAPGTTYDTVVQAWSGSCQSLLVNQACNDDFSDPACVNACSAGPVASEVSFHGEAGEPYYFEVGSYDQNSNGCELCLNAQLTIEDQCDLDFTPPVALLVAPSAMSCACGDVPVLGTAADPETFADYLLESMPISGGSWTLVASGIHPVVGAELGTWSTGALVPGWYYLRLTVHNACGMSNSAVVVVLVDQQFDSLSVRSPVVNAVLGGTVCIDGTAWDHCFEQYTVEVAPVGGSYRPVDPAHPFYGATVITDGLASLNTSSGIPDGVFTLRTQGRDDCGHVATDSRNVTVDNTPPVAVITSPVACQAVDGLVEVRGTASDANLASWALYYTGDGVHGWSLVSSGTSAVVGGLLGTWDTHSLPACAYVLRLVVTDAAIRDCNGAIHNQTEYNVSVTTERCANFDADHDGDVDLNDFGGFSRAFTGPG